MLDAGRIAGDRVLGFRFADAKAADDAWGVKFEFVALVNTPGLARLRLAYDAASRRLRIREGDSLLAEAPLDEEGRRKLAAAVQAYVLGLPENPLAGHPGRMPIRLVGDGETPRYQDSAADFVTLHSRASLAAAAAAAGQPSLDELRFRTNVVVDGASAWEELGWAGRRIRIGRIEFTFVRPKGRCLATHANPATGERDLPLMQTLLDAYPSAKPTFAIALSTISRGGIVRVGDPVTVMDDG